MKHRRSKDTLIPVPPLDEAAAFGSALQDENMACEIRQRHHAFRVPFNGEDARPPVTLQENFEIAPPQNLARRAPATVFTPALWAVPFETRGKPLSEKPAAHIGFL
jgi:hypothetical protein